MKEVKVDLKWWTFDQNNSGGYFIQNEDVDHYVAIQAINVEHAKQRAYDLFAEYSEYCSCCGERWHVWVDEQDGHDVPCIYDEPYTELKKSSYRHNMIMHYVDGSKEKYTFKDGK